MPKVNLSSLGSEPLISFVCFGRNDGYSPQYISRVKASFRHTQRIAENNRLPIEIILVEWNPTKSEAQLHEALCDIQSSQYVSFRIITVPEKYHRGFRGYDEKGIHLFKAFNVGLRRAKGTFVTPVSVDVFFTNELFKELSSMRMNTDHIYRIDRWDFTVDEEFESMIEEMSLEGMINALEPRVVRHHEPIDDSAVKYYGLKPLHTNASGDFLLLSKARWCALRGYNENCDVACLDGDGLLLHAAVLAGATEVRLSDKARVYKAAHGSMFICKISNVEKKWQQDLTAYLFKLGMSYKAEKWLRGIFNFPKRKVAGLQGEFSSHERNYVLPIYLWTLFPWRIKVGPRQWGMPNLKLEEHIL